VHCNIIEKPRVFQCSCRNPQLTGFYVCSADPLSGYEPECGIRLIASI